MGEIKSLITSAHDRARRAETRASDMAVAVRARCVTIRSGLEALECLDDDGVDLLLECLQQLIDDVDTIEAGGEVVIPE